MNEITRASNPLATSANFAAATEGNTMEADRLFLLILHYIQLQQEIVLL